MRLIGWGPLLYKSSRTANSLIFSPYCCASFFTNFSKISFVLLIPTNAFKLSSILVMILLLRGFKSIKLYNLSTSLSTNVLVFKIIIVEFDISAIVHSCVFSCLIDQLLHLFIIIIYFEPYNFINDTCDSIDCNQGAFIIIINQLQNIVLSGVSFTAPRRVNIYTADFCCCNLYSFFNCQLCVFL